MPYTVSYIRVIDRVQRPSRVCVCSCRTERAAAHANATWWGRRGFRGGELLLSGSVLLCFFLVLAIRAASVQFCSAKTVVALRR